MNPGRAAIVIIAIGNPSRGDDALGPGMAAWLQSHLQQHPAWADIEIIEDFQLHLEHALDVSGRKKALFIDAGEHTEPAVAFSRLTPSGQVSHTSHAMAPAAVLRVCQQIGEPPPAEAYVLCVRGESFALGAAMSAAACTHMQSACQLLNHLLRDPVHKDWGHFVNSDSA